MAGGKTAKAKRLPPWFRPGNNKPYNKKSRNIEIHHILTNDPNVINSIVEKAGIRYTDIVLEINPGLGNLTRRLLQVGKAVVAVEADPILAKDLELRLKESVNANLLKVIQGDVLNCELPYFDVCVANLPLNSFSPIAFKLLFHRPLFRRAVIMVQREFALKLTAQPNDSLYCSISANIQLLASVTHLTTVRKNMFSPQHKSDVSLVGIEPKDPPPLINFKEWFGLVGICFSCKRNKIVGSVFKRKSVLSVLEKNNNKSLRDVSDDKELDITAYISALGEAFGDLSVEGDDEDEEMEVESGDKKDSKFKGRVWGVLKEAQLQHKRCCQLTQTDILSLLGLFNKAGIYFS